MLWKQSAKELYEVASKKKVSIYLRFLINFLAKFQYCLLPTELFVVTKIVPREINMNQKCRL